MRYGVFSALAAVVLLPLTLALAEQLADPDARSVAVPAYDIEVLGPWIGGLVPGEGVEPSRLSAAGFKPAASAIPPPRRV